MEDISRELEREIAKSKPKPFRKNRKIKILIVDDFGKVVSGNHIKTLLLVFFFVSVVSCLTLSFLFYHYSFLSRESVSNEESLLEAEKKISELTGEKEVLMARLVILGKDPEVKKPLEKNEKTLNTYSDDKKTAVSTSMDGKTLPSNPPEIFDEKKSKALQDAEKDKAEGNPGIGMTVQEAAETQNIKDSKPVNKTISIEKFAVIRNRIGKDLLVRFDIRNITRDQRDITGRIFTILKPDNGQEEQWLVVPESDLKNGVPSENQKGQYFSIARFKPVKFRIKSAVDPEFYKKASIFIFNNEGDLIFEKLIEITEVE